MDLKVNLLRTEQSNFLGATPDGFGDFVHVLLQLPTGSSWIRNRWVLWVPRLMFCSNCVLQERTVTPTRDMGLRYEHHWFSVLPLIAIKFNFTCTGGNFGNQDTNDNVGGSAM